MTKYRKEDNPYPGRVCGSPHDIYRSGFLAAEKLYGWHRNCAETPVPQLAIDAVFYTDRTLSRCDMLRFHTITGWYFSGYYEQWVRPAEITHWREIPEVGE